MHKLFFQESYLCADYSESVERFFFSAFSDFPSKTETHLKAIWSFGNGSEIFRENSPLFDFHLKAAFVCIVT